jgi:hypothetical protein
MESKTFLTLTAKSCMDINQDTNKNQNHQYKDRVGYLHHDASFSDRECQRTREASSITFQSHSYC